MKKVIHIMDELCNGGVNSFVHDLCQEMKDSGVEVHVIVILNPNNMHNDFAEKFGYEGIYIETLNFKRKFDALLGAIPILRKRINEIANGDDVVCNLHLRLSTLLGAISTIGLKNVYCFETYHSQYKLYTVQNFLLRPRIVTYIPCSKSAEKEMLNRFHIPPKKLHMIPNGIRQEEIRKFISPKKVGKSVIALSVGRFSNQKNFTISVKAFSQIVNPAFSYRLVGDGEERQEIEKLIINGSSISLLGQITRDRVFEELSCSSIVVMPSLWEGLSIFLLEAIAMRRPLMLSNIPSFIDVVGEQELGESENWRVCSWGYLIDTTNENAYFEAMNHFLKNRDVETTMSENVAKIAAKYDIQETAREYLNCYKKSIESWKEE